MADLGAFLLAAFVLIASPLQAASTCTTETFEGVGFSYCRIDLAATPLRLWLTDSNDQIHGSFRSVDADLAADGRGLDVAMNGGMYHDDRTPVGLYVESGEMRTPLVTSDGPGNFGLLPNGVLCLGETSARILETLAFAADPPDCLHATQSGPMLVIDGALHPRFIPDSPSIYVRNGVGIGADPSVALLVISNNRVNFHTFARFFRDRLGLDNALYLDGNISRLYAPQIGRNDFGLSMGPILGTATAND